METIVKDSIELLINTLVKVDEVNTNLYLIRALNLLLKENGNRPCTWEEADIELNRVCDTIRINKFDQSIPVICKKLDVILPCQDILAAAFYIHRTFKPVSAERIKQSVLKIQSQKIEDAKKKLAKA